MIPLNVVFRDFPPSDFVYNSIYDHVGKLQDVFDRIISARVIVSSPHKHQHKGRTFHIQLRVHVPGRDILVSREPGRDAGHENIYIAIRDAFRAATRLLEDHAHRIRGHVKLHEDRFIQKIEQSGA